MLHFSTRRWRILPVVVLVTIGCLAFAAAALAWTNDQIKTRINQVEANGGAKYVNINARSGSSSSGYVDATVCTSTYNTPSGTYYYAYPFAFRFRSVRYYTDGGGHLQVVMGSPDGGAPRC